MRRLTVFLFGGVIFFCFLLSSCSSFASVVLPHAARETPAPRTATVTITATFTPSATPTPFAPLPPTAARTPTPFPSPTPSPSPSPSPTPTLPAEAYLSGIYGHQQYFSIGCEAAVAVDWAAYFGVAINEFNFQYHLPLSDNPDKGFVGDVNGPWGQTPPYAYGVHAGPVADLLREYGLPASGYKEMTLDQIKSELAEGHPVIAWVIGNVVGGFPAEYTDREGDTSIVAAYEHVVLVTGYNTTHLRYNSNGRFYDVPFAVFENSWGVLGNMALVYEEEKPVE